MSITEEMLKQLNTSSFSMSWSFYRHDLFHRHYSLTLFDVLRKAFAFAVLGMVVINARGIVFTDSAVVKTSEMDDIFSFFVDRMTLIKKDTSHFIYKDSLGFFKTDAMI